MPKIFHSFQRVVLIVLFIMMHGIFYGQINADSLMEAGAYNKAIEWYQQQPATAAIYNKMARAYSSQGSTGKALKAYEKSIQLDSTAVLPRYNRAKLLLATNQILEASMAFYKLKSQFPENATYAYYHAQTLEEIKSVKQAMDIYEVVLQLDPNYRKARVALVPLLIKNREIPLAIKYCKEVLEQNPDDLQFNSLIAQAYYYGKMYQPAIDHLERLFELNYDTDFNLKILALSYFQFKEWDKSIQSIDRYLDQYDSKNSELYFVKSQAHLRLQQYEAAQDAIEYSILYKRPSIAQEYLQMAAIKGAQEDYKGTFEALLLAYEENKEDEMIAYQLALAADKYFADKKSILKYYERFLNKYGSESNFGSYIQDRANDLKKEIFMNVED